jgi:hypothetical protein
MGKKPHSEQLEAIIYVEKTREIEKGKEREEYIAGLTFYKELIAE